MFADENTAQHVPIFLRAVWRVMLLAEALVFPAVCTVMDFSAGALPIVVKFCTAVRPDLRLVFSHFWGIALGMAEFWASTGVTCRGILLAKSLVTATITIINNIFGHHFSKWVSSCNTQTCTELIWS